MKKTTKIVSLILACIFCFAALSVGLLASDLFCTEHRNAGWYLEPSTASGEFVHIYRCNTCHKALDAELCGFTQTFNCTIAGKCYMCDRLGPAFTNHNFSDTFTNFSSTHHIKICLNDSQCEVHLSELHNFSVTTTIGGVQYLICTVCGANKKK